MAVNLSILLTIIMPMAIMTSQAIPSPLFYVLTLVCIIVIYKSGISKTNQFTSHHKHLLLCMAAPTIITLFSSVIHGKLAGLDLEGALRFFLGVWILGLAYSTFNKDKLKFTLIGFIGATALASAYIFYLLIIFGGRPNTTRVYNAVGYGSLTALLMIISLFSIKINFTKYKKTELFIKLALAAIALVAVIFTQTRTAWLAMPLFILIAAILFAPVKQKLTTADKASRKKLTKIIALAAFALLIVGATFSANDTVRNRVAVAYNEAINCVGSQNTTNNSICIRFQLWRASLDMLSERPIAGNGSKRYFNDYLQKAPLSKGIVSEYVAKNFGESHNDILLAAASFGYPGAISLILIYFGPTLVFARRLSFKNPSDIRAYAAMGLCFCLGFFIFGLTETMFRSMRTIGFYALGIALFTVLSSYKNYEKARNF